MSLVQPPRAPAPDEGAWLGGQQAPDELGYERRRQGLVEATRVVSVDRRWHDDLRLWLRKPVGGSGPEGWFLALLPDVVDEELWLPPTALQTYQRTAWTEWFPDGSFELRAHLVSRWTAAGRVQEAWRVEATVQDRLVAYSLSVSSWLGTAASAGTELIPPRPPPVVPVCESSSFVIGRELIHDHAVLRSRCYEINEAAGFAQALGHPNSVVPSPILGLIAGEPLMAATSGSVEIWFRHVVPTGAVLTVARDASTSGAVALRLLSGRLAAVANLGVGRDELFDRGSRLNNNTDWSV